MNKLYYRGQPYDFQVAEIGGKRYFVLSKEGDVVEHVEEGDLDIRSRISMILDDHYRMSRPVMESNVFG